MTQNLSPAVEQPLRNVLIVTKKTTYQQEVIERQDARLLSLLAQGDPSTVKLERTHREHLESLEVLCEELRRRNIALKVIDRGELLSESGEYDVVISFGGDGTFLETSHTVFKAALMGFNSATFSSHGHWCLANKANIGAVLDDILAGKRQPVSLLRLEVLVNGKPLPELSINEVFVCHPCPAGTSRYHLEVGGVREEQRSSGLMVGSGVGSTGWMRSAGGSVLPAISQQFQYLVREACIWPGENPRLLRGILDRGSAVKLVPIMATGKVFIDGQHVSYDFARGDEVVIRASARDLRAYIAPEANDGYGTSH